MVRIPRRPSLILKAPRGGQSFRKDSAELSHSTWSGGQAPGPVPAQAEIRRLGPAHRAAAPKQPRMHSTEDVRRRAVESEKGLRTQCLRKVQPQVGSAPEIHTTPPGASFWR